jgi:hypothetical protein
MKKDIRTIITYLDSYLTRTRQATIDPIEANAVLEKAGLLSDSKDRLGKPLSDLLRKGHLPHAFQSGGKGSSWTIPPPLAQDFQRMSCVEQNTISL